MNKGQSFEGLSGLYQISDAISRSISPENPEGAAGGGGRAPASNTGPSRGLGEGWKCRPYVTIDPGKKTVIANIQGPAIIRSIWMTGTIDRSVLIRIWWDKQSEPSVCCPIPDFFAAPYAGLHIEGKKPDLPLTVINSLPICVNPNRGMNCFFQMPFRKSCVIEIENLHFSRQAVLFYQINYTLEEIPEGAAYFHTWFNRENPLKRGEVYIILPQIQGIGQYVGTAMGWSISNGRWWGEGEIKFYIDDDTKYPTICGTGTEDYFLGAFDWDYNGEYQKYSTAYAGMYQVICPDSLYNPVLRQAMYRWHIVDPIHFKKNLHITIQALGWRDGGRYYPETPDICSTAYWYQTLPAPSLHPITSLDDLEII